MGAHYSDQEMEEIESLKDAGLTWMQVAQRMNRFDKKGLPNARGVMEKYTEWKKFKSSPVLPPPPPRVPNYSSVTLISASGVPMMQSSGVSVMPSPITVMPSPTLSQGPPPTLPQVPPDILKKMPIVKPRPASTFKSLESLSRKERIDYIIENIHSNPRSKQVFLHILSRDEQELFLHEYLQVLSEQDSLNNAEEQQLFNAILNLILYYRARTRDTEAYDNYKSRKVTIYDTRWQEEARETLKQYNEGIKALKLSREQRLKDLSRVGNTFLDYTELVSKVESQESIAQEILDLGKKSENELKKLQANGWVIFGSSPANNPEVQYEENSNDTN